MATLPDGLRAKLTTITPTDALFALTVDPDAGPWLEGRVVCVGCGRCWHAVRPVWAAALECPDCHQYTGIPDPMPRGERG